MKEDYYWFLMVSVICLVTLYVFTKMLILNILKVRKWKKTVASINDYSTQYDPEYGRSFSPVFGFIDEAGKEKTIKHNFYTNVKPKIKENLQIRYNPENSTEAIVESSFELYVFPLVFIIGSITFWFIFYVVIF